MADDKTSDEKKGRGAHLEELLNRSKKFQRVEELIGKIETYKDERQKQAYDDARMLAYKFGEENGIFGSGKQVQKPEDLSESQILAGLQGTIDELHREAIDYLGKNLENVVNEMDDEHLGREEIVGNSLIRSEAGKEYEEMLKDYVGHRRQLDQAKEIVKEDFDKLSPVQQREIYGAIAPYLEKEKEKELRKKGKSSRYIQAVIALVRASAEEGHIPESYVADAKKKFVEEAQKKFDEHKKKYEGKKGIVDYVRDSLKKLVNEGGVDRDEQVLRLMQEMYKN